jgi:hypothetical protein
MPTGVLSIIAELSESSAPNGRNLFAIWSCCIIAWTGAILEQPASGVESRAKLGGAVSRLLGVKVDGREQHRRESRAAGLRRRPSLDCVVPLVQR